MTNEQVAAWGAFFSAIASAAGVVILAITARATFKAATETRMATQAQLVMRLLDDLERGLVQIALGEMPRYSDGRLQELFALYMNELRAGHTPETLFGARKNLPPFFSRLHTLYVAGYLDDRGLRSVVDSSAVTSYLRVLPFDYIDGEDCDEAAYRFFADHYGLQDVRGRMLAFGDLRRLQSDIAEMRIRRRSQPESTGTGT